MGALNVVAALYVVPRFEVIFQDSMPGRPLPALTLFIVAARFPLAFLALAWPIAGMVAVWRRTRGAIWIVGLGLLFFFALVPVTVFALLTPMVAQDGGMSDAPLDNAAASR